MKYIKLLILAIIIVGGIYGIMEITSGDGGSESPSFTSPQANQWKQKIEDLCKDGKWSAIGYTNIESGVHTDRVTSNSDLLSMDEELSLKKYLFALSCSYVKDGADKLFKQSSYADSKVRHYEEALDFLQGKTGEQGGNSNLAETAGLYSAYHQIMGAFSFGATAHYSRPLKAYSGGSADGRKSRIQGMAYYKSHFCKNNAIRSKVENLDSEMKRAEQNYYLNLEKCIEAHYRDNGRIEELLEDQIRFDEISTNSVANTRLNNFINNN